MFTATSFLQPQTHHNLHNLTHNLTAFHSPAVHFPQSLRICFTPCITDRRQPPTGVAHWPGGAVCWRGRNTVRTSPCPATPGPLRPSSSWRPPAGRSWRSGRPARWPGETPRRVAISGLPFLQRHKCSSSRMLQIFYF